MQGAWHPRAALIALVVVGAVALTVALAGIFGLKLPYIADPRAAIIVLACRPDGSKAWPVVHDLNLTLLSVRRLPTQEAQE